MDTRRCSKCSTDKPEPEWHPSQWARGGWCKDCYREWHRARYTPKAGGNDAPRNCALCGASYQPKSRSVSVYCSRECKNKARHARIAAEFLAAKPVDRWCLHCGGHIEQVRNARAKFCSEQCNSAAHNVSRKIARRAGLQQRSELVNRAVIGDRDRWRCGICGGKITKDKRWPDLMCPSLDHIVPLSQGGSNDSANLRVTHLICNVRRKDKGGGEQLALI